jgi:hypothetical protein
MRNVVATSDIADDITEPASSFRRLSRSERLTAGVAIGIAAAGGFAVGVFATHNQAHQAAHTRGACIALEFAENFGAVSTPQKRQAMRAMTTSASPQDALFPPSVAAFDEACVRIWASAVRFGR